MPTITDVDLVPEGLELEHLSADSGGVGICLRSAASEVRCPVCGGGSKRVHSHYERAISDLPWHGVAVTLHVRVRRFFCDRSSCKRRIFCERLPEIASHARKTDRLEDALTLIGFEMGGRAGARLAVELGLVAARDALLRRVRAAGAPEAGQVRVLGVDDWAGRKGERYGTILVDLERRRPVDLLSDRSSETLAAWLETYGGDVEVICRDRYRPYIEGASTGAPDAVQVADRFHIFKNLYDVVEKVVEHHRKVLNVADDDSETTPPPIESHPNSGHPGWGHRSDPGKRQQRLKRYKRVVELRGGGMYVEDIAREVGLSQHTVVCWLNAGGFPERKRRKSKKPSPVAPYVDYLERRWKERCINMSQLFREIKEMGYEGSYDAVADHLRCLRKGLSPPARAPAADEGGTEGARYESQQTARLLMLEAKDPEALHPDQLQWLEQLRERCPELAAVQELAGEFARIMGGGEEDRLAGFLQEAEKSDLPEIRTFAKGVGQDEAAVRAAIRLPYSNGQVEGQVHRLKLLKRGMYGRANFDLLRARTLGAAA